MSLLLAAAVAAMSVAVAVLVAIAQMSLAKVLAVVRQQKVLSTSRRELLTRSL